MTFREFLGSDPEVKPTRSSSHGVPKMHSAEWSFPRLIKSCMCWHKVNKVMYENAEGTSHVRPRI